MRVCDRCKKEIPESTKESLLVGVKFELCDTCANYISEHIRRFKGKRFGEKVGDLFT